MKTGMTDDLYVKAMASPHHKELRSYLIKARWQGARFDDDIPFEIFDLIPESLEKKYHAESEKARKNPIAYRELLRFLWGKTTIKSDDGAYAGFMVMI